MYWALPIRSAQETGWHVYTHFLLCDRCWLITRLCWQLCKHNRRCWARRQLSVRSNWRALSWIGQRPMQRRHLLGRLCSDFKQSSRTRKKLPLSHLPPLLIWTTRCCSESHCARRVPDCSLAHDTKNKLSLCLLKRDLSLCLQGPATNN